jgi:hypothetical protein
MGEASRRKSNRKKKVAQIQHGWVKPLEGKVIEKVYFTPNL